jgi:hypothetical protein
MGKMGAQRQHSPFGPNGVRSSVQILQPGEGLTSVRVFMERGKECV